MKISQPADTTVLLFTDLPDLDPIRVFLVHHSERQGGITITCFGEAWSGYWGAMGKGNVITGFFLSCDTHYLAGKMKGQDSRDTEPDFDTFKQQLLEAIRNGEAPVGSHGHQYTAESLEEIEDHEFEAHTVHDDCEANRIAEHYMGEDWYEQVPHRQTQSYTYLCRIIDAVKAGLKQWQYEQVAKEKA